MNEEEDKKKKKDTKDSAVQNDKKIFTDPFT